MCVATHVNVSSKRLNFISVQQSHKVATKGGTISPYSTGYDKVMAHRTGDLFASTAKKKGVVIAVDPKSTVTIKYDDGEVVSLQIGKRYGVVTGTVIPHEVVTSLKVGDKVKEGSLISHNTGFFQVDPLYPSQVVLKTGVIVKTALMECTQTFEDSCEIDSWVADQIETNTTVVKDITVDFSDHVRNMVTINTQVNTETILCILESEVTGDSDLFDEETLQTLANLSAKAPKAGTQGVVEKIEVFYHGDIEDMSESLRALAEKSDRERASFERKMGRKPITGFVGPSVRMGRDPLALDQAMIKVYINHKIGGGVGDKGVFANQLKTVISNVLTGVNETESGIPVRANFSYKSIANRMVESPNLIGTTITLLKIMSDRVHKLYLKKKGNK